MLTGKFRVQFGHPLSPSRALAYRFWSTDN